MAKAGFGKLIILFSALWTSIRVTVLVRNYKMMVQAHFQGKASNPSH
jgi:hypothetical protein